MKVYEYIAVQGDNAGEDEKRWAMIQGHVEQAVKAKLPKASNIVLQCASWKKVCIDFNYEALQSPYSAVVMPSLVRDFELKLIGPNKPMKPYIHSVLTLWLSDEI